MILVLFSLWSLALAQGRDYYVSPTGSGSSTVGTFGDPFTFPQFLTLVLNPANVWIPDDQLYFAQNQVYTILTDQVLFNFTRVNGGANFVRVGTYDPTNMLNTDQNTLGVATIRWATSCITAPFLMEDAWNIAISNIDLDHATVGLPALTDSFILGNSDVDDDYDYNIYMKFVYARGKWVRNVHVKEPTGGSLNWYGINTLSLENVYFQGAMVGALVVDGNLMIETDTQSRDIQQHLGITVQNSEIGETGDASQPDKGTCIQIHSFFVVYIYNNLFTKCGDGNTGTGSGPNFITLQHGGIVQVSWNLFTDLMTPSGSDGGYAVHVNGDIFSGILDHNVVQRLSRHAFRFDQTLPGVVGVDLDGLQSPRYLWKWYVSFNLLEMVNAKNSPIILDNMGCSGACMADMNFAHNTMYFQPDNVNLPVLWYKCSDGCENSTIINNVLYSTNGTAAAAPMIDYNVAQSGTVVVGNVYVKNNIENYPYFRFGGSSYFSLGDLRAAGFETRSALNFGAVSSISNDLMLRIINLPVPTPDVDPNVGNELAGGSSTNGFGDRINGIGVAVTGSNIPVDTFLRAPGRERALTKTNQIPSSFTEAYNFFPSSPGVGLGINPSLIYSDPSTTIGDYDLLNRFILNDAARPNLFDSGAFRFVAPLSFNADTIFGDGQFNYQTFDFDPNVDVTFQSQTGLGNYTVEAAFDLPLNASLAVANSAILLVRTGNATSAGLLSVGFNATLNYFGQFELLENATLSLIDSFNATFNSLIFDPLSTFQFGTGSNTLGVVEQVTFAGELKVLVKSPITKKRMTQVVNVAKYPDGKAQGNFQTVSAVPSYPNSECDQITATQNQGSSTLSVTLTTTTKPSCSSGGGGSSGGGSSGGGSNSTGGGGSSGGGGGGGSTTSSDVLPLGAIIGIAVGGVVIVVVIVLICVCVRQRRQAALKASMNARIRKSTMEDAERQKERIRRESQEEPGSKKRANDEIEMSPYDHPENIVNPEHAQGARAEVTGNDPHGGEGDVEAGLLA